MWLRVIISLMVLELRLKMEEYIWLVLGVYVMLLQGMISTRVRDYESWASFHLPEG